MNILKVPISMYLHISGMYYKQMAHVFLECIATYICMYFWNISYMYFRCISEMYFNIYLECVFDIYLTCICQVFPECIPTYVSHIFLIHIPNICEIYFCNILRHLSHEYITEYIDAIYLAIYLQNIFNLYI